MPTKRLGYCVAAFMLGLAGQVFADEPSPAAAVVASTATAHRSDLNEMQGKFQSKGDDPKSFRLMVDGGFNVQFTYDAKTAMINGGHPITIDDLNYGDMIVVHYAGKDLYAVDLDRVSKVQQPY